MRSHRWLLVGFTALLGIALGCQPFGTDRQHTTLGAAADQFRAAFNADTAKVRVVMLVSPTCGVCLRGAADIQKALPAKQPDPRLPTYVIWVPKLNGQETDVPVATRLVPDERAAHLLGRTGWAHARLHPDLRAAGGRLGHVSAL